ncbi:uncharacterized protein MONBRDRAFT_2505, partial [Monosiga brevicollis MX1]
PSIVPSCIAALETLGLDSEGLFRVPGSGSQIDTLKSAYDAGQDLLADGSIPEGIHADAIAGCLKLFLRQLADPVMTQQHYSTLVKIGNMAGRDARLQALRAAVERLLPPAHSQVLALIMPFLKRVAAHANVNKMSVSNLAMVFGPTIMPAPKDDMGAMLRDATAINTLTSEMIEYSEYIFAK